MTPHLRRFLAEREGYTVEYNSSLGEVGQGWLIMKDDAPTQWPQLRGTATEDVAWNTQTTVYDSANDVARLEGLLTAEQKVQFALELYLAYESDDSVSYFARASSLTVTASMAYTLAAIAATRALPPAVTVPLLARVLGYEGENDGN